MPLGTLENRHKAYISGNIIIYVNETTKVDDTIFSALLLIRYTAKEITLIMSNSVFAVNKTFLSVSRFGFSWPIPISSAQGLLPVWCQGARQCWGSYMDFLHAKNMFQLFEAFP